MQVVINKGNQKEDLPRQSYVYRTGHKVLLKNMWKTEFTQNAYVGPYVMIEVQNNEIVHACRGNIAHSYNLYNITAFKEWS